MILRHSQHRRGFTLVELAIVLSVSATLFVGLYRLISSGQQQVKDSAAASQQSQLINSVKSFLSSAGGNSWLSGVVCAAGCTAGAGTITLPLPTTNTSPATCIATVGAMGGGTIPTTWCSALPSGFSTGTVNAYGQKYNIYIRPESAAATTSAPATYSILIVTSGGNTISDTSGGRISSLIGGDGGFVYSTGTNALGAYGAWTVDLTTYGLAAGTAGTVVSRSYVAPEQLAGLPWLARTNIPGDINSTVGGNTYNTMAAGTNLILNKSGTIAAVNTLYGTGDNIAAVSSYGGRIFGINETILGNNDTTLTAPGSTEPPALQLNGPVDKTGGAGDGTPCIASTATTSAGVGHNTVTNFTTPKDAAGNTHACHAVLQVNGNQATTGMVQANVLWASSFIYGQLTSDIRMKKNINAFGNALDNVMKLKPVTFRYKQDDREDMGFIAQDLQKIYPLLVVGKPDGMLGVNYMGLLAPVVSSIQELKRQNDNLREQIASQAVAIKQLQRQLDKNQ